MMQLLKSVYYRTSAQTQNLIFRVKRKLKECSGSGIIEFMVLAAAVLVVGAILIGLFTGTTQQIWARIQERALDLFDYS